ncbi:MAG: hypothetical protein H7296_14670 [Bacteroidia bacterium]|nr:hypothetical protein [Bacteroidia bacterium]
MLQLPMPVRGINLFTNLLKYVSLCFLLVISACSSYYQKNEKLMDAVYQNKFDVANKLLDNDKKWEKRSKNKLLFYLNKGTVLWMQGDYVNSNIYFRKADFFVEDFQKNYGLSFLSILVNPNVLTYPGEDYEQVLLHYYGALNYLSLNQYDEALVEGKRMLEKMDKNTDKYKSKNKFKRDAFAHNLLGIIYDAKGEYNDAFIAYRNAYEVYKEDYLKMLSTPVPAQLKLDLLRTAYFSGFYDEVKNYEQEFNMVFDKNTSRKTSNVVFFWNNGLCPVKDQLSVNFAIIPYGGKSGWVEFVNLDLGFHFPFYLGDNQNKEKGLLDMKFVRIALPKFISRQNYYTKANLISNQGTYNFSLAEDINAIAFRSLEDRLLKELGEALLRVALKQFAVYEASQDKNNAGIALAASIYSALSEQADTRNWQLLPSAISYTRLPMSEGKQTISFEAYTRNNEKGAAKTFDVDIKNGQTKILMIQTPEFIGFSPK